MCQSAFDIETPFELTALASLKDGTVLVGGERGSLFSAPGVSPSMAWKTEPFPVGDGVIVWLGQVSSGLVVAVSQRNSEWLVHRRDEQGTWERVMTLARTGSSVLEGLFAARSTKAMHVVAHADRIDFWLDGYRHGIDAAGEPIQSFEASDFSMLRRQGNGILSAYLRSSLATRPNRYSKDSGDTWTQIDKPDRDNGKRGVVAPYVFQDGQLLAFGQWQKPGAWELIKSSDNGKSWRRVSTVPGLCERLVSEISTDQHLVISCRDGQWLVSTDRSATWSIDIAN